MVSSWYFGDGTVLFNQARTARRDIPALTPLDPVLTTAGVRHEGRLSVGFRVARTITRRFGIAFSFDATPGEIRMTDALRAGIETSAASFQDSLSRILDISPISTDVMVDSTATIRQEGGTRLSASGTLNVSLATGRQRVTPYVTVGAGVMTATGDLPGATLIGRYRVTYADTDAVIDETDTVRIRLEAPATPIFIAGGGVTVDMTAKSGIRADVRVAIGSNNSRIVVQATPSAAGIPSTSAAYIGSAASIVFATEEARQRSLSGPAIDGFETFTGSGRRVETAVTFGYFLRF
jgi:hypothetical protein